MIRSRRKCQALAQRQMKNTQQSVQLHDFEQVSSCLSTVKISTVWRQVVASILA